MRPEPVIRSRQNPVYKQIRSLLRRDRRHQERAFLVEGPRFIVDAGRFGAEPTLIALEESRASHVDLPGDWMQIVRIMDDALFATVSDTVTSQGAIGVFPIPEFDAELSSAPLVLIVDGVQDPGNLGTLIRSAAGAGADRIFVLPGTADPWSPKTVRAAAATHFAIPIEATTLEALTSRLPAGTRVVGADAAGTVRYDQLDLTEPTALVIGAEGHGIAASTRTLIDQFTTIPLHNEVESLNAGVAGSILLFEASRQRSLLTESGKSSILG